MTAGGLPSKDSRSSRTCSSRKGLPVVEWGIESLQLAEAFRETRLRFDHQEKFQASWWQFHESTSLVTRDFVRVAPLIFEYEPKFIFTAILGYS